MKVNTLQTTEWQTPRMKLFGVELNKINAPSNGDGTITVNGYFTSDQRDMVGDIITRGATERAISAYRKWGNIRYMHLPRPVAKVTRIGVEDGLEWNEVEIRVIDPQAVFEVEQGLLTALSVGILIAFDDVEFLEDGGLIINDYTLAEISLVDHPANYDAFLKGIKSIFTSIPEATAMNTLDEIKLMLNNSSNKQEEVMDKVKDLTIEDAESTDEVTELVDEVVEDVEDAEIEKGITDDTSTDTVEADETVETIEVEKEIEVDDSDAETDVMSAFKQLFAKVSDLEDAVLSAVSDFAEAIDAIERLSKSVDSELEVTPEAQVATGQSEDVTPDLEDEVNDSIPADRKSAVSETRAVAAEKSTPKTNTNNLKSAIAEYFANR